MMKAYLVLEGWDGHDESPHPAKVFIDFDKAKKFCQERQIELTTRHLKDYPGGSIRWQDCGDGDYYQKSYVNFGDGPEYRDTVLIIREIECVS